MRKFLSNLIFLIALSISISGCVNTAFMQEYNRCKSLYVKFYGWYNCYWNGSFVRNSGLTNLDLLVSADAALIALQEKDGYISTEYAWALYEQKQNERLYQHDLAQRQRAASANWTYTPVSTQTFIPSQRIK